MGSDTTYRRWQRGLAVLCVCQTVAVAPAEAQTVKPLTIAMAEPPQGFEDLLRPQDTVADIYFGGRKLGQSPIRFQPGKLRFLNLPELLDLIPELADRRAVMAALDGLLPTHADQVCSAIKDVGCGQLAPSVAAIMFDESRFRVDLFFNPRVLNTQSSTSVRYLNTPDKGMSLVNAFGLTLAGAGSASPTYNVQNRTIVGSGEARLLSNFSYASDLGLRVDDLLAEIDKPGFRYSAGVFWAPGIEFTGRRRIVGVGLGSQTDTRLDKEQLRSNPLILFLAQRSQVEILREGRLLGSRSYEAGNHALDTSALPDGAYELLLRIREVGGRVREERRFFIKNAWLPPLDQPFYHAYAGLLMNDRANRWLDVSGTPFVQLGTAHRLRDDLSVEANIIGTSKKGLLQLGGVVLTRAAQFRLTGLVSTKGDIGALMQVNSASNANSAYTFNVRRVWSRNGDPLLEYSPSDRLFEGADQNSSIAGAGSYTQANASLTYRLGKAQFGMLGTYRKDRGGEATYAYGPTLNWPVMERDGVRVSLHGDLTHSNRATAAFFGLQLQFLNPRRSLSAMAGSRLVRQSAEDGGRQERAVGAVEAAWQRDNVLGGDVSIAAGAERNLEADLLRFSTDARNRYGSAFADVTRTLGGATAGTQYNLAFQTSAAINGKALTVGGRDVSDSAVVVKVSGGNEASLFDVLVNGAPLGQLRAGQTQPFFLPPYRHYAVRIQPVGGEPVSFDSSDQLVSVYPGTVSTLVWDVEPAIAVYGRILWPDGSPVANALIEARRGIGQTDRAGFFQMEIGPNDTLQVKSPRGSACNITLGSVVAKQGRAALGTLRCDTAFGLPMIIAGADEATGNMKRDNGS